MTARDTVLIATFAALTAVLGLLPPLPVPLVPVPITAQTMGVMLAGLMIGPRRGGLAMLLLLGVVALGIPLLAGGRGGLAVFAGPSAGYLIGWPIGAFVTGMLARGATSPAPLFAACLAGGIGVVYACGIPGVALISGISVPTAALASAAFLPGDLIKAGVATAVAVTLRRAYPRLTP